MEDIIDRLNEFGIDPIVVDPYASEEDAMREYRVHLQSLDSVSDVDCVIVAVAHDTFKTLTLDKIDALFKQGPQSEKVLVDVKGIYPVEDLKAHGFSYWRL